MVRCKRTYFPPLYNNLLLFFLTVNVFVSRLTLRVDALLKVGWLFWSRLRLIVVLVVNVGLLFAVFFGFLNFCV